jgi:uncharacterized membrane protein
MKKTQVASIVLITLSFFAGAYVYPSLPENVASHWNAGGEVNGYMPRFWGVFLLPALTALLVLFMSLLPRLDPLRENILRFRGQYERFILVFTLFMTVIYAHTLSWNLGARLDTMVVVSAGTAFLFWEVGGLMEHTRRNWFIGIRTPWTMSDDGVWERTHRLGGKMFKACAAFALLGAVVPQYALLLILAPTLLTAAYTVLYSYLEYRKLKP